MGEFAQALFVSAERDASGGAVDVVERQLSNRGRAGGVNGGQGDDQAVDRVGCRAFDGADLVFGQRQHRGGDLFAVQPPGRIGEDSAVLLGVAKQRP